MKTRKIALVFASAWVAFHMLILANRAGVFGDSEEITALFMSMLILYFIATAERDSNS